MSATPWFYASDSDAEIWSYGGQSREEAIETARDDRFEDGPCVFYITTGHKSRGEEHDDCDPGEFEYTMDSITPERIECNAEDGE